MTTNIKMTPWVKKPKSKHLITEGNRKHISCLNDWGKETNDDKVVTVLIGLWLLDILS